MRRLRNRKHNPAWKKLRAVIIGAAVGAAVLLLLSSIAAWLIEKQKIDGKLLSVLRYALPIIAVLSAALLTQRLIGRQRRWISCFPALLLYLILLIGNLCMGFHAGNALRLFCACAGAWFCAVLIGRAGKRRAF